MWVVSSYKCDYQPKSPLGWKTKEKQKKNRGKSYLDRKVALIMDCERNLMKVIKL